MEWSRIKTIILIILAVTNIGLLVFLAQRELLDQGAQQEARQNAILFLQNNGISVADEEAPGGFRPAGRHCAGAGLER